MRSLFLHSSGIALRNRRLPISKLSLLRTLLDLPSLNPDRLDMEGYDKDSVGQTKSGIVQGLGFSFDLRSRPTTQFVTFSSVISCSSDCSRNFSSTTLRSSCGLTGFTK